MVTLRRSAKGLLPLTTQPQEANNTSDTPPSPTTYAPPIEFSQSPTPTSPTKRSSSYDSLFGTMESLQKVTESTEAPDSPPSPTTSAPPFKIPKSATKSSPTPSPVLLPISLRPKNPSLNKHPVIDPNSPLLPQLSNPSPSSRPRYRRNSGLTLTIPANPKFKSFSSSADRILSSTPDSTKWDIRPCVSKKIEDVVEGMVEYLRNSQRGQGVGFKILNKGVVTGEWVERVGGVAGGYEMERDCVKKQMMKPRVVLCFCEEPKDFRVPPKWGMVIEGRSEAMGGMGKAVLVVDFWGGSEVIGEGEFGLMKSDGVVEMMIWGLHGGGLESGGMEVVDWGARSKVRS